MAENKAANSLTIAILAFVAALFALSVHSINSSNAANTALISERLTGWKSAIGERFDELETKVDELEAKVDVNSESQQTSWANALSPLGRPSLLNPNAVREESYYANSSSALCTVKCKVPKQRRFCLLILVSGMTDLKPYRRTMLHAAVFRVGLASTQLLPHRIRHPRISGGGLSSVIHREPLGSSESPEYCCANPRALRIERLFTSA